MRQVQLDRRKAYNKEWGFIIAALSDRSYQIDPDLDWIRIETLAAEEGVTGILYKKLKGAGIPQSALASLKDCYLSIAARNIINSNVLERLENALGSIQAEVMTLKGTSLLNSIYPDIGMRGMNDLDLMVRPEKQKRFVGLLHSLGYNEDPLSPHIFKNDRIIIDIHSHPINTDRVPVRAKLLPAGTEPIWANSVPWREGCQWLRRPDDTDNIILLSQHLMKHSFSRLIWLVDILRLVRYNNAMFLTDLLKRSDYLRQGRCVSYTFYLLNRIFYHVMERRLMPEAMYRGLSRLERGILEAKANGESLEYAGPVISMFCIQGFRNKVALGWESLFPKDELVRREITGALEGKNVLYYPLRFLKIAASLLKRFCLILGYIIRG